MRLLGATLVDLVVTLTQVQNRNVTVAGTSTLRINCTGLSVVWSSRSPQSGAFKAGSCELQRDGVRGRTSVRFSAGTGPSS